jgi:hypothetical protein
MGEQIGRTVGQGKQKGAQNLFKLIPHFKRIA